MNTLHHNILFIATLLAITTTLSAETPEGMVWIPGGTFEMGADGADVWENEKPAHQVELTGYWIDTTEVTNKQFKKFIDATGYTTTAERAPTLEEIMAQLPPGTPPPDESLLIAASLVFTPPDHPVDTRNVGQWWSWIAGANWHHPEGSESSLDGRDDHPVVHVSWDDAKAYADWAGKQLPTEAQWEYAARGGREGARFVWGDDHPTDKKIMANIWQGHFPDKNLKSDGFGRTSPVKTYAPNGYGLYDMSGNVWEWCADWYRDDTHATRAKSGTIAKNPKGPEKSFDPQEPYATKRVIKGGSFLCHVTYCESYRPSARRGQSVDTGISHVGIRCVLQVKSQ